MHAAWALPAKRAVRAVIVVATIAKREKMPRFTLSSFHECEWSLRTAQRAARTATSGTADDHPLQRTRPRGSPGNDLPAPARPGHDRTERP